MKNNHFFAICMALALCIPAINHACAQGVAFNATGVAADASAMVDVSSTTKGMLIPRMTNAQISAISSPATGLMVYQTDGAIGFYHYNGTMWVADMGAASGTTNYLPKFNSASALGNSLVFDNGTAVSIGTTSPSIYALFESVNPSTGPYTSAVHGVSGSISGTYLYTNAGVLGESSNGSGVVGISNSQDGVYGVTSGSSSAAVIGENMGTGGYGVVGSVAGTGTAGYFDGGPTGYGVVVYRGASGFGTSTPASSAVVEVSGVGTNTGSIYSQAGIVADGATTYSSSGVFGQAGWRGVYGYNNGSSGGSAAIGVQGTLASGSSYVNGYGLYGNATGTGPTNYGVYATAYGASTNYAGYFSGTLYATTASSSIKSFKIDDPRDPANKYLYHSSVESNEMMDLYKGHVTTDASGDGTVQLPSYFVILNKDFEYQLTCVGQFAQAIVSQEISNNQFKIKTDKPNVKVSWQVSGVRQDPAANAYRVKDEVEKPTSEKGTYLQPELYGMGPEKAPGYLNSKTNTNGKQPETSPTPNNAVKKTNTYGGVEVRHER